MGSKSFTQKMKTIRVPKLFSRPKTVESIRKESKVAFVKVDKEDLFQPSISVQIVKKLCLWVDE